MQVAPIPTREFSQTNSPRLTGDFKTAGQTLQCQRYDRQPGVQLPLTILHTNIERNVLPISYLHFLEDSHAMCESAKISGNVVRTSDSISMKIPHIHY